MVAEIEPPTGEQPEPANESRRWSKFLELLPNYAVALGTIVLACFAYKAWDESLKATRALEGQLKEMKLSFETDRAYLLYGGLQSNTTSLTPEAEYTYVFQNYGRTPAEIRLLSGRCDYSRSDPVDVKTSEEIPGLSMKDGLVPAGWILEPGKTIPDGLGKLHASTQDIQQAKIGNGKIFCVGLVVYNDMRNGNHETKTTLFYNFGAERWMLYPSDSWNHHT